MMQQNRQDTQRSVRNAYDAGIMFAGAALVVIVVGLAIVLMSQAFAAAPVVSSMFAVGAVLGSGLFVLIIVRLARQFAGDLSAVHTTVAQSNAQAFGQAAREMVDYMKAQQIAAPQMYLPPIAAPQLPPATNVPRQYVNGVPVGVKLQTIDRDGSTLTCSPDGLRVALEILADGEQPTREQFKRRGVVASMEVAGAVDWLAGHGLITKAGQGVPTRWADGVMPDGVGDIADSLRPYCPSLPHYLDAGQGGGVTVGRQAGQAGRQAGRGRS